MKFYSLLFLALPLSIFSQEDDSYNLDYNNSKKAAELCTNIKSNSFMSNAEADDALSKILSVVGASKRFVLAPCENINNALAVIEDGMRYILYDPEFVNSISDTSNYWANMSILAHEVGHHINGHTLGSSISSYENKIEELEADEFSGFVMQKIGATLEQSIDAIASIAAEGDDTYSSHPNRTRRIKAITKGFNNAFDNKFIKEEKLSDWEEYYYRAEVKYENKDYDGAMIDYSESIKLKPTANAYLYRGLSKYYSDNNSGAIYDLQRSLEIDPEHWRSLYYLGLIKRFNNDHYGALSELQKYFNIITWEGDFYDLMSAYYMAASLFSEEVYDQSLSRINWLISEYDITKELDNEDESYFYELRGLNYVEIDSFSLAIKDFEKSAELMPEAAIYQERIGDTYAEMGEYDEAIKYYNQAIKLDKDKTTVYAYRAYAHENKEDYFSALFDMNEAIKLAPEYAYYYFKRGEYKIKINDKKGACSDWLIANEKKSSDALDKLIELCGYQKEDFYTADDYYNDGERERKDENFIKAIELFYLAIENGYSGNAYDELVLCYQNLEQFDKALEMLNSYNADENTDTSWFTNKLVYLKYRLKDYTGAINEAKQFIESNKINPNALDYSLDTEFIKNNFPICKNIYFIYSDSLKDSAKYDESIEVLNNWLKLLKSIENDDVAGTYYKLAEVKKLNGDYLGGMQDINEYIKIWPEDHWGFKLRGEIKLAMGATKFACEDFNEALMFATKNDNEEDISELSILIKANCE